MFRGFLQVLDNNAISNEALNNELKGCLFEFMVAQRLSEIFSLEKQFLHTSYAMRKTANNYLHYLENSSKILLAKLPELTKMTTKNLLPYIPETISSIEIIGKALATSNAPFKYKEADILIKYSKGYLPISLKLCTHSSFINTKSGGCNSFIKKYFKNYKDSSLIQKDFNNLCSQSFELMGHALYQEIGETFLGQFDENWNKANLPGKVNGDDNAIIRQHYSRVSTALCKIFNKFYKEDKKLFKISLLPLVGHSDLKTLQVICFHDGVKTYNFKGIHITNLDKILKNFCFDEIKYPQENQALFKLPLNNSIMQIRVKPMDKFTMPSLKINCSLKFLCL